jgi:thymidylate synthase (FAD)
MHRVIIQDFTVKNPVQMIGYEAGICWGADVTDPIKNEKRGWDCIKSEHGRTLEFPQIYMTIKGYSARMMRELYTHIGGMPTRLQESTRYIDYESGFNYVTPHTVEANPEALNEYNAMMNDILTHLQNLENMNIPREDTAMGLPLGMESGMVLRTNLRNLIDMSHQRMCSRAFWEFREFMDELKNELGNYSDEWKKVVDLTFKPKCEVRGYCVEKKSCGRKPYVEQ